MMKKRLVISILVATLFTSVCSAADYNWFTTSTRSWKTTCRSDFLGGKVSLAILDSLDKIYERSPHQYLVYELGSKRFVQVRCTFDLYEIQGDKLVNKYLNFN